MIKSLNFTVGYVDKISTVYYAAHEYGVLCTYTLLQDLKNQFKIGVKFFLMLIPTFFFNGMEKVLVKSLLRTAKFKHQNILFIIYYHNQRVVFPPIIIEQN